MIECMSEKSPNFLSDAFVESKDKAVSDFVERVQNLQEKFHVHGHGVSNQDEAASIEERGLYTAWSTLQDLTHALSENPSRLAEQVHAWDYGARQYIVIIAIPKHNDYFASDAADEERSAWENREISKRFAVTHVFESVEKPQDLQTPLKSDKRIPPKRIIGYWDDIEKVFHQNLLFEKEI